MLGRGTCHSSPALGTATSSGALLLLTVPSCFSFPSCGRRVSHLGGEALLFQRQARTAPGDRRSPLWREDGDIRAHGVGRGSPGLALQGKGTRSCLCGHQGEGDVLGGFVGWLWPVPLGFWGACPCPKGTQWGWSAGEVALVLLRASPGLGGTWFPSVSPAPRHALSALHLSTACRANHERPARPACPARLQAWLT